jgi:signal transduction histidine kinase
MADKTTLIPTVVIIGNEQLLPDGLLQTMGDLSRTVRMAADIEEALGVISRQESVILLLDLEAVHGADPLHFLERIRRSHPKLLTVVISPALTVKSVLAAIRQGAFDVIGKPLDLMHLRAILQRATTEISVALAADRLKSQFVGRVAHELRSPLSTIHEQLAMLISELGGQISESQARVLSRAKEKINGLIFLIGDLLDLSRIETGAMGLEPQWVQLETLLADIIAFLNSQALTKQQTLVYHQPEQPLPPIKTDPLVLESIFGNLITNAINYTQPQGVIEIQMLPGEGYLTVHIADNGFGMEKRHLEKIFEPFYRIKTDKTRYINGTGLGLAITKALVDGLKGTLEVRSLPDQGSTFTVRLPVGTKSDPSAS